MKRLARILLNGLTALSALLCAYAVLASIFAMRAGDPNLRGYDVFQALEPPRRFTAAELNAYRPPPPTFSLAGFRVQRGFRADYAIQHGRVYTIPYWFLSLLFAVPLWLWARAWHRTRKTRLWAAGMCPYCGYDLRATPERCPECGIITTKA